MQYYSQCSQDEFAHKILNYKNDGYFVDIGSCDPIIGSNSYALECIGWNGLCFDIRDIENFSSVRKSKLILGDARLHDYAEIFSIENASSVIDYLSIDIDEASTKALEKLLISDFKFKVITIEHDYYRFGDLLRLDQRRLLTQRGYYLLCEDVDAGCDNIHFFEDWWINPSFVVFEKFNKLKYVRECHRYIVQNI